MNLKPNKHSDYSYDFNKNWFIKYFKNKLKKNYENFNSWLWQNISKALREYYKVKFFF